jgi:hypothetical protein
MVLPVTTYRDADCLTENTWPVKLDSNGDADIFFKEPVHVTVVAVDEYGGVAHIYEIDQDH